MKVLLANWVYNWGSTGYIVRDLRDSYIAKGHQVFVAAAINLGDKAPEAYLFSNKYLLVLYGLLTKYLGFSSFMGSWIATLKFIIFLKKCNPDIVHIHILNNHALNMYFVLKYLGKHDYKTVITHHAEFYYTSCCGYSFDCNRWKSEECTNCPSAEKVTGSILFAKPHRYWQRMRTVFNNYKTNNLFFTAVSPWVRERSVQSEYLKRFGCSVVKNGVDTSVFYYRTSISNQTINKLSKLGVNDYYLYVTASFVPNDKDNIKGGYYIAELARRLPKMSFVVVATSCGTIQKLPTNVIVWGKAQTQSELAELYSHAKLTILTSKRETFSMICAESLCCGTPVVGFKAGGPETIAIPAYSSFCEFGDIDELTRLILQFNKLQLDKNLISVDAEKVYSKETMSSEYLRVYNSLLRI